MNNKYSLILLLIITLGSLRAQHGLDRNAALADAKVMFSVGDHYAAVAILEECLKHQDVSVARDIEMAQMLIMTAVSLRDSGARAAVISASRSAVEYLDAAERKNGMVSRSVAANIETMRGYVSENLMGDTNEALQHYQKAVQVYPKSTLATANLARLNRQYSAMQLRLQKGVHP